MAQNKVIKALNYSIGSNLFSLIVSFIVTLVVPKFMGVEQYGFWQLYLFYVGYIGILHLGWIDGIYLREGGKFYSELDKKLLHTQFMLLWAFELIITIIFSIVIIVKYSEQYQFVYLFAILNCVVIIPRTFFQYILQCTGRIKEYAKNVIIERAVFCLFILIVAFLSAEMSFKSIILCDFFSKLISLCLIIIVCKDIVFTTSTSLSVSLHEAGTNISVGCKLLISNFASLLLIGIVRFFIQTHWSIEVFGKISFSLSLTSFVLVFINAVSVVIFPIIKRSGAENSSIIYESLGILISVFVFLGIGLYKVLSVVLVAYLPKYTIGIEYLAILFPITLYESRTALLNNTYLKACRKERILLLINCISFGFAALVSSITVFYLNNITLTVFSLLLIQLFRCVLSDVYISKLLHISLPKTLLTICSDFLCTIIFLCCFWGNKSWFAMGIYYFVFVLIMFLRFLLDKKPWLNMKSYLISH